MWVLNWLKRNDSRGASSRKVLCARYTSTLMKFQSLKKNIVSLQKTLYYEVEEKTRKKENEEKSLELIGNSQRFAERWCIVCVCVCMILESKRTINH